MAFGFAQRWNDADKRYGFGGTRVLGPRDLYGYRYIYSDRIGEWTANGERHAGGDGGTDVFGIT